MNFDVTYYSRVYRDFVSIQETDYRAVVHFYEEHEEGIRALVFSEYFEILAAYTEALFRITEHPKHILMADVLIAESIQNNIKFHKEEDIFYATLLRKAHSYNKMHRFSEAKHILHELLKIDAENKYAKRELKSTLLRHTPEKLKKTRATSIFLFFLAGFIILIELFCIRTFYRQYIPIFEYSRISVFVSGLLVLLIGEWRHRRRVNNLVKIQ